MNRKTLYLTLLLAAALLLPQLLWHTASAQRPRKRRAAAEAADTLPGLQSPQLPAAAPAEPAAPAQPAKTAVLAPRITFDHLVNNFGTLKQGEQYVHRFTFVNSGEADLKITSVQPDCGCTATTWSQQPIPAGQESYVEVRFNTAGKMGPQTKRIRVNTNLTEDNVKVLVLEGDIVTPVLPPSKP